MTACTNRNGDALFSGILDGLGDVLFGGGIYNQSRFHLMLIAVGRRGILVLSIVVAVLVLGELSTNHAIDGCHVFGRLRVSLCEPAEEVDDLR